MGRSRKRTYIRSHYIVWGKRGKKTYLHKVRNFVEARRASCQLSSLLLNGREGCKVWNYVYTRMFVEDKLSLLPAGVVERRRDKGLIKNDLRRMALTLHGFCQANFRLPLDIKPGKFLKVMHCK